MNEQEFQIYFNKMLKNRVIKAPFMNLVRVIRLLAFQFTHSHRQLKKMKNQYRGERCYIIGNGPSLTVEDLEKLNGAHCFAFNRIYEVFAQTSWRPEFYMVLDNNVMKDITEEVNKLKIRYKFLNIMSKAIGAVEDEHTIFFCSFGPYRVKEYNFKKKKISEDISKYVSLNYTVTCAAIETAIYLGFKEIILLGVDNSCSRWIDSEGKVHFKNVEDYRLMSAHQFQYFAYQDAVNSCFECYQQYAEQNGIKIYNATRGGELEAFERVDFDKLLD